MHHGRHGAGAVPRPGVFTLHHCQWEERPLHGELPLCAQSAHYHTEAAVYPLCDQEEILAQAKRWQAQGVPRFGIVTAGRRLSGREVEEMCRTIRRVRRETEISLCVSFGLLREEEYRALKEAGVERVHNNLETSRCYFPQVCTTHTFEDKLTAIRAAQAAGPDGVQRGDCGDGGDPGGPD